jgi:hypothetical protein
LVFALFCFRLRVCLLQARHTVLQDVAKISRGPHVAALYHVIHAGPLFLFYVPFNYTAPNQGCAFGLKAVLMTDFL